MPVSSPPRAARATPGASPSRTSSSCAPRRRWWPRKFRPKRITRSMRELRRHLPDAMPLSGLAICAVADQVVVKEGARRWQADSGQYLLGVRRRPGERLAQCPRARPRAKTETAAASAQDWLDRALDVEESDPRERARSVCAGDRRRPEARGRARQPRAGCCTRRAAWPTRSAPTASALAACGEDPLAALQPRGAARRHGPQGRGDRGLRGCIAGQARALPTATTTSRCCARSSAGRGRRSGTWRSTAS